MHSQEVIHHHEGGLWEYSLRAAGQLNPQGVDFQPPTGKMYTN